MTDELICFVYSKWWQVNDLDAGGNEKSLRQSTAIQQHHAKVIGQTVRECQGPDKVAHGQGMLAVEQEGGPGRHCLINLIIWALQ